jgi:hypothetical protein
MLSHPFLVVAVALGFCGAAACHRPSADERMVGIWQFTGMDATMDYVFKPDHTFEVWAESMDVEQSKGPWLQMNFGTWKVEGDELVMEYKRPRSAEFEEFLKSQGIDLPPVNRRKVLRFGADKIEFPQGGPFIRANARRGI